MYSTDQLKEMTVKELKNICKEMGISGYSRASKDTLLQMIEGAQSTSSELEGKSVKELRRMAREAGVTGYSRMRKTELVEALNQKPVSMRKKEQEGVNIKCHVTLINREDFVGKTINEVISYIESSATAKMAFNLPKSYVIMLNGSQVRNKDYVLKAGDELEFVAKTGRKG